MQTRQTRPDPLRLAYRDVIREMVRMAVLQVPRASLKAIDREFARRVPAADREMVRALVAEQLERLHEGVLARYGLRPSEFAGWKSRQTAP